MTLAAISPRFAMSTLENMAAVLRFDLGESLPDVHFVPLLDVDPADPSPHLGGDGYLGLHRLKNEEGDPRQHSRPFRDADLDNEPRGRSDNLCRNKNVTDYES